MKIKVEMNTVEVKAINDVKEAYSEFKSKLFELPIVSESRKGFSVQSWLNGQGYTYSIKLPTWVICEYAHLTIKYKARAIAFANIINNLTFMINDWAKEIQKDVVDIKNRHM